MLFSFSDITYFPGAGGDRRVRVSGRLDGGEVLGVRGPSGAGKTTLLRILARLQPCCGGEARLNEKSWLQISGPLWRAGVHYIAQKPVIFDGSVADNLARPFETRAMSHRKFDSDLAGSIMSELLLAPALWDQDARTLSGGEAARLALARSLLLEPTVLLLDEPAAALDGRSREALYGVLSRWLDGPGRAALLVTHNDDYRYLKKVSFLDIEAGQREV